MLLSDELIYLQMQKTGSTHISSLLLKILPSMDHEGAKHSAASSEQMASGALIASSIRNPWDWYLSLWTYGAQGGGGLRNRLNRSPEAARWRRVYHMDDEVASFRNWLLQIHDPASSPALTREYWGIDIADVAGFMTLRYLRLCCRNIRQLSIPERITSYVDLEAFERGNCYVDYFIRQESLEDDLCEVLERVRALTNNERCSIYLSKRTNTSNRRFQITDYYDQETIELVRDRDRLLIEKFDYLPPTPVQD